MQNLHQTKEDVQVLTSSLHNKVTKEDLDVILLQKANKQSVANAL